MLKINQKSLKQQIAIWAQELGFAQVGITDTNFAAEEPHLQNYLQQHFNGAMSYLEKNQEKRLHPNLLMSEVKSIICCRMNYLPTHELLKKSDDSIALFALGKNYSELICKRLELLVHKIKNAINDRDFTYRVFSGNAPILEKALAAKAGLGWIGKNSLLINQHDGSFFFLGEIFVNLDLPIDQPVKNLCGSCTKCIGKCPTKALVGPKVLNANKCISYLTIEHKGDIEPKLQKLIGTKIFGCDDCQKCCPWNRFAKVTKEEDFLPQDCFENTDLEELLAWDEQTFLAKVVGTSIKRIGFARWRRNLLVAMKNRRSFQMVSK